MAHIQEAPVARKRRKTKTKNRPVPTPASKSGRKKTRRAY